MALSGSVSTNKYNGTIGLKCDWNATQSHVDNTSTISWTLKSDGSNSDSYWVTGNVTLLIGGQTALRISSAFEMNGGGAWSRSGTVVLTHDDEGNKEFVVSITAGIYAYNSSNTTGSKEFALDTILRESKIGATDANVGSVATVIVSRKSTSFTHSIKYIFGSLAGYIDADGAVSNTEIKLTAVNIAFTVPTDFYAQIPTAKTGICTLICTTYSGDAQIGSAQIAEFIVTAAESSCKPRVSGTVVDSNDATIALTGDNSKLVRYYSDALCTVIVAARNSARISQKKIGGADVSGDTQTISGIETDSVVFAAMDSRGYSDSVTVKYELIPYVKLTSNPFGARTNPTNGNAILSVKGNCYNGSFGAVDNALTIRYRIAQVGGSYGDYVTITPTLSGNAYSLDVALSGLDYEHPYTIEVVVTDKLDAITKTVLIKQGIPIFDWGENDFRFNKLVTFGEETTVSGLGNPTLEIGQYIDFHNGAGGTADYFGRLYVNADNGDLTFENTVTSLRSGAVLTSEMIFGFYSVPVLFSNGVATFSNSNITSASTAFVQRRSSSVGNNTQFNTHSNEGSLTISGPSDLNGTVSMNILILNP